MKHAVILIGIQGAGKTTFFRDRLAATHLHVSLDQVSSRDRERELIGQYLTGGRDFAVDNTNVLASERAVYIRAAKAAGYRITGYLFKPNLRASIGRNNYRTDKKPLPAPAVARTYKRIEPPRLEEGFDELFEVEAQPGHTFTVSPIE